MEEHKLNKEIEKLNKTIFTIPILPSIYTEYVKPSCENQEINILAITYILP